MGPCDLQAVLDQLPRTTAGLARLLETRDDGAVTPLSDDLCLVQTVDFFTPIVDDACWFGQIAAANALSDIYAMGARPLTAMNLVGWPSVLGNDVLAAVLRGGSEKVAEAGAELAGGHSIEAAEPTYGLAVLGVAHPDELVYNGGARPGDLLVLSKPLGIGVLATALKRGLLREEDMAEAIREAARLNAGAARAMQATGVDACTDVSGFGLLGHLSEMLDASAVEADASAVEADASASAHAAVGARIWVDAVPMDERVPALIADDVCAGGLRANRDYLLPRLRTAGVGVEDPRALALCDPQTSGGLLLAVPADRHGALLHALAHEGERGWTIGEVLVDPRAGIELAAGAGPAEETTPA